MKASARSLALVSLLSLVQPAAHADTYTNYIYQLQFPSLVDSIVYVEPADTAPSALAIDPGGANFELYTIPASTGIATLLESTYVGTYIPAAKITLRTEDTSAPVLRTRADRPFWVDIEVSGLLTPGEGVPEPATKIKFLTHVQSYGAAKTQVGVDRTQALLLGEPVDIVENGPTNLTYLVNSIPGADRSKVCGEQRFTILSYPDFQTPEAQLDSRTVEIWPVADGSISGIAEGALIRFSLPTITFALNDVYPGSTTFAQVYKGNAVLGTTGAAVPGSGFKATHDKSENKVIVLEGADYAGVFDSDGWWTMELVTVTPFGPPERLAHVTFNLDRTIQMNGSFTTIE